MAALWRRVFLLLSTRHRPIGLILPLLVSAVARVGCRISVAFGRVIIGPRLAEKLSFLKNIFSNQLYCRHRVDSGAIQPPRPGQESAATGALRRRHQTRVGEAKGDEPRPHATSGMALRKPRSGDAAQATAG
jgi:hypothetical protein